MPSSQKNQSNQGKSRKQGLQLVIQDVVAEPCASLLQDEHTLQAMKDFQPDAVTAIGMPVPDAATDSCGCLLSHALNVPMIDIDCGMTFWSGPASVPQFGSGLRPSDLKTFPGYSLNLVTWSIKQAVMPVLTGLLPTPWSAVRDRLGLPRTASTCRLVNALTRLSGKRVRQCDVLLDVIMGSWLLEYARPLAPHQALLGPGTPRPPHTIEQHKVADFVGGATSGLVLVAFGTSFQFNSWLSLKDYQELAAAFTSLTPVRILWHINTKALPKDVSVDELELGSNILLVPLVDYNDILGHPHTQAFVSHCGIHSVYEAVFHGVPVVGVPFMFEQAESGAKLAARGAGVMSSQAPAYRRAAAAGTHYTREHVAGLIRQVLSGSSFAAAAEGLSLVLQTQARQRHQYAAAADAVELAIISRLVEVPAAPRHKHKIARAVNMQAASGTSAGADAAARATDTDQQHSADRMEL